MSQAGNITPVISTPQIATRFDADTGNAVPILNVLELVGESGGPISTEASGNTVTFKFDSSGDPTLPITFNGDTGSAMSALNIVNVLGDGTGVVTTGAGSTLTLSLDLTEQPEIPTLFVGNTGTAAASSNQIQIKGVGGVTTAASSNLVEISSSSTTPLSFPTDSGTAVPAANVLSILGDTGLNSTGAGSDVTLHLDVPVTVPHGGTAATSLTDGGIMLGSGTSAVTVTAQPTNGQLLIGSTGVDPVLGTLTAPAAGITITEGAGSVTFALADDLAALEALATTGMMARTNTSTWVARTITGTSGITVTNGDGVAGAPNIALTVPVIETLGGTNQTTYVKGDTLYADATDSLEKLAIGSLDDVFTVSASGLPEWAPSTSGTLIWQEIVSTSVSADVGYGYIMNNAALITLTLPTTAAIGDQIQILGKGAGFYKIAQNADQVIHFLAPAFDTTTGVGGSITSTEQYAPINIRCITADDEWVVQSSQGNFTIV